MDETPTAPPHRRSELPGDQLHELCATASDSRKRKRDTTAKLPKAPNQTLPHQQLSPEESDSTPQAKSRGLKWDLVTRARVCEARENGLTKEQIRDKHGVPFRTQTNIFKQGPAPIRPNPKPLGRRKVIDEPLLSRIIEYAKGQRLTWVQLRDHFELKCTWQTVRNALCTAGYHRCKVCQKILAEECGCPPTKATEQQPTVLPAPHPEPTVEMAWPANWHPSLQPGHGHSLPDAQVSQPDDGQEPWMDYARDALQAHRE